MSDETLGCGCLIFVPVLIGFALWLFGVLPFQDTAIVFVSMCKNQETEYEDCPGEQQAAAVQINYSVRKELSEVHYSVFAVQSGTQEHHKLIQCSIVTDRDWTCTDEESRGRWKMVDGQLEISDLPKAIKIVPRWRWYMQRYDPYQ